MPLQVIPTTRFIHGVGSAFHSFRVSTGWRPRLAFWRRRSRAHYSPPQADGRADFFGTYERHMAEAHVRATILERFTYLGTPQSPRAGQIASASRNGMRKGETHVEYREFTRNAWQHCPTVPQRRETASPTNQAYYHLRRWNDHRVFAINFPRTVPD